jgi:hypothetical protein
MENLNAEAVKTALKCCGGTLAGCKECPNYNNRYRCNIEADALTLINSQEQRIKELTEENEGLRAKGRWKGAGMGDYYCSVCCNQYSGGNEYNFCPNCGAKMKGE